VKRIAVALLVLLTPLASAQTDVSGTQSGLWTAAGSPYRVTGQVTVPSGQTLTVDPGVEVNFQGHYQFTVNGNLQAIGTEGAPILFTTDSPAVGWGGIRISSSVISALTHCRIEYGKTAGSYPDMHGGGLALLGSDAVVTSCVFADNEAVASNLGMGGAVYASGTGSMAGPLTRFIDCSFIGNHAYGEGGAIKFTGDSNTEIIGCEFIANDCGYGGGAVSCYGVYDTKMIDCLFVDNYTMYSAGGAVNTLGFANTVFFVGCTISGNSAVTGDGGGVNLAYADAVFVNCIVYDNPGMYSDDVFLDWGGQAEIHYSCLALPTGAVGSHNLNANPQFVNPALGDYELQGTSPCIDEGIAYFSIGTDVIVDLDPSEYHGTAPDMGAREFLSAVAAASWYCGSGVNMDTYTVVSPLILGGTFQGSVGISAPNTGAVIGGYLGASTFPIWGGEGLVNVLTREVLGLAPGFGPSPIVLTKTIPNDPTYAGLHVWTQAVAIGGGQLNLTCAFDCTVGY
jgi:hypothetical protein